MDIKSVIEPRSIVLYGVSKNNPEHPANIILRKNRSCGLKIYCVNPSGGEAEGEKFYTSPGEVPEKVDAAVFVIRADRVAEAIADCADAGIKGGILISGGFAEAGRDDLQEEIITTAREKDFIFIGPNGLGVYSPPEINTLFFPDERFVTPPAGNVGLVSQSGGILVDLMIRFTQEGVGISRALSIGNKAVFDEVDALRYFRDDPRTDVIGVYFEGFAAGRGREFIEELRKTDKPVVIFKAGKTPASAAAISSHTAAMAGDYNLCRNIISSAGAVEVVTEPEFLSACEGLAAYGKRRVDRAAIITMSGGHGVIAVDYFYEAGIAVDPFSETEKDQLKGMMSPAIQGIASFTNPIDLTGSAVDEDCYNAMKFAADNSSIDAIFVLFLPFIPAISSGLPPKLAALARDSGKPVVCYVPYIPKFGVFIEAFEANGVPVAHSIDGAINMLAAIGGTRK